MAAAATAALVMVLAALAGNGDRERASMATERRDAIEESVVRLREGVSWGRTEGESEAAHSVLKVKERTRWVE